MFVIGPTLYTDGSLISGFESGEMVTKIMTRKFPMVPNVKMGVSDVRDVAQAHLLALEMPGAIDHRVICCGKPRWFVDIVNFFAEAKPQLNIPVRKMPSCFVWIASLCSPTMKRARKT